MKRAIFWILVILAGFVVWLRPGHADTLDFINSIGYGKQTHRLPDWYTIDDDTRTLTQGGRIYLCLTDRGTGRHWTTWGPLSIISRAALTNGWTPGNPVQTTLADEQVCFPATGPVAIGEPAYYSLSCPDGCSDGKPLNWPAMNQARNIAGSTVKGEPCGPAAIMGFYELPRLHTGNVVPVTRCQP